jgi:hypothetical protein
VTCDPLEDCAGDLYIGLFDEDPVLVTGPPLVSGIVIPDPGMTPGSSVPYMMSDVPCGQSFMFVFIDVNGNASPVSPVPDDGDIVSGTSETAWVFNGVTTPVDNRLNFRFDFSDTGAP